MLADADQATRPQDGLAARLQAVRSHTVALVDGLSDADCTIQSMPEASPAKWHLAHTSWFFETFVLAPGLPQWRSPDPAYAHLFNSYYHGAGTMHPRPLRGMLSRPTLSEVMDYRHRVDEGLAALLARGATGRECALIALGIQHEQQHQELLLTDILHAFSLNPLAPALRPAPPGHGRSAMPLSWVSFDGGVHEFGAPEQGFAFDNERPRHRRVVEPFALASRLVTNAEFREFVRDGGYRNPLLWMSDGWDLVQAGALDGPLYWRSDGEREFTLHGERDTDPHAPVGHLSWYEADAFARWAGARLPTEFEWELAASAQPVSGHFADDTLLPLPAEGEAPAQLYGDCWEWTSSDYAPYPRFRPAAGAVGEYNGKFMCNQYVLRGGSCATPPGHLRPSYRNFFAPGTRWQFTGIRLARDA